MRSSRMTTYDRCQKTLDWYEGRFKREFRDAKSEYWRLCELFKDVCWYNFETSCANWREPWPQTDQQSYVELQGLVFHRKWHRGCWIEHGNFPFYYCGPVRDAPKCPPEILLNELEDARRYMLACERQVTAPTDWAPGGPLYEELRRTTAVGKRECVYAPRKKRTFSSC